MHFLKTERCSKSGAPAIQSSKGQGLCEDRPISFTAAPESNPVWIGDLTITQGFTTLLASKISGATTSSVKDLSDDSDTLTTSSVAP